MWLGQIIHKLSDCRLPRSTGIIRVGKLQVKMQTEMECWKTAEMDTYPPFCDVHLNHFWCKTFAQPVDFLGLLLPTPATNAPIGFDISRRNLGQSKANMINASYIFSCVVGHMSLFKVSVFELKLLCHGRLRISSENQVVCLWVGSGGAEGEEVGETRGEEHWNKFY